MADDLVRYRLPDGSIGFALDRSEVPAGAVVLPPPETPKGSLQTGQSPPPSRSAAQSPRAPRKSAAKSSAGKSVVKPPSSGSTEQAVNEARKRLREKAEEVKRRANAVPCERVQRRDGTYDRDCSGRARAKKAAKRQAAQLEREREELIDACMEDDSCTPGLVMDDDEEEPEEEEPKEYRGPQRWERDDHDVRDSEPPDDD